jgi:hypothetical protein
MCVCVRVCVCVYVYVCVCVFLFNVRRKPWHVTTVLGGAYRTIGRQEAIRAPWSVLANLSVTKRGFIRSCISTVLQLTSVSPIYRYVLLSLL